MRSVGWKKSKKLINVEGVNVRGGWIFFKIIREMRVNELYIKLGRIC